MLKDKIKEIRKSKGLTQEEFAKKLGVSRTYVGELERGRIKGTNVKIISKLADISGKSMEYFLDDDFIVQIKPLDALSNAMDMMIDNGIVDKDGNIIHDIYKDMLMDMLKREFLLKIKSREL
jgi:transcriptional regulator with XRE-family HTH domain